MPTPIEMLFDGVTWEAVPNASSEDYCLPYVTHFGVLELFDQKVRVYRLSNGQAVVRSEDFAAFFGCASVAEFQAMYRELTGKDAPGGVEFMREREA